MAVVGNDWKEDEDVRDSWDAEEEVTKPPSTTVVTDPPPQRTRKPKAPATEENSLVRDESEQEKKARLSKLVKEKDLENAMSLFGLSVDTKGELKKETKDTAPASASPFDSLSPSTPSEFDQFVRIVAKRLQGFEVGKPD